jgi:hypothetical protein
VPRLPSLSDLVALLQAQTDALASLPRTLVALNRSVIGLSRSLEASREAFGAVQRVAVRLDRLLDDLDEPVRELGPGLRRLAVLLNDPVVDELPDTLRRLQDDLLPVVRNLRDTQQRLASIATSTDRITNLVDEAGARLGGLPASLLRRGGWRGADARVVDETVEPPAEAAPASPTGDGSPDPDDADRPARH